MHNTSDILALLEERTRYPVDARDLNRHQFDYIAHRLAQPGEPKLLILPENALMLGHPDVKAIRELLLDGLHPSHLADIGSIWRPFTSFPFQLIVLSPAKPDRLCCIRFSALATLGQADPNIGAPVGPEVHVDQAKLNALAAWLNSEVFGEGLAEQSFSVDYACFDPEKILVKYYRPDLLQNEASIRGQEHALLSDISDVIVPRRRDEEAAVLKPRDFVYPLRAQALDRGPATSPTLQQGDIVLASVGNHKAYLVTEVPSEPICASPHSFIIRLKDNRVTPEYLFLYLQSDTGRKYAERHASGLAGIQRISAGALRSFPVVLPTNETAARSPALFRALFLAPEEDRVERITNELFRPEPSFAKSIEADFFHEVLANLSTARLRQVQPIIESDLKEIQACLEAKALKSCIVLCGSVLEAVLLDWLSEIERHNYIDSQDRKDQITLRQMIKRFAERRILVESDEKKADRIRERRNLIHPKQMLTRQKIEVRECEQTIKDLRHILNKRFAILARRSEA